MRALAVLLCCATACNRHQAPPRPRLVQDSFGRSLRTAAQIHRVISLAPSTTEILYRIGAGDLLVGVDAYSNFPPEVKKLARLGSNLEPSLEKIVGLHPDLVFTATSANSEQTARSLDALDVPVFVSRAIRLDEIYLDIERIGEAVSMGDAARALCAAMRTGLAEVSAAAGRETPTSMALIVWTEPLVVTGSGSHVTDLIHLAGGVNIAEDSPVAFPNYSLERLLVRAPQVLVVGTHSEGGAPPMTALKEMTNLPAVKNGRIFVVDGDLIFRPGPRVVDGARALKQFLHPSATGAR